MYAHFVDHGATLNKYLQHLRWSHNFLGLSNAWWNAELKQRVRGALEPNPTSMARRPALRAASVQQMVRAAEVAGECELADALAVARGYLFRVPSEMVPLCWGEFQSGSRSGVKCGIAHSTVVLAKRKNDSQRSSMVRQCSCKTQGRRLCAHHHMVRAAACA